MMTRNIAKVSIKRIADLIPLLLALISAGFLIGCTKTDHKPVAPLETTTIACAATPDSALVQVAHAQGYFLHEGLETTPQMYPYGKVALQALLDGKADFATVAETPVMFSIMKGEKIAIVATILTSGRNNAVIARKDKGIQTAYDLKLRKIGAAFGTISEFFMDSFLLAQGISRKDLTVINLKPEEMGDALAKGEVDAVSAFTPFITQIRKGLGGRVIFFQNEDIYTQTFNIVAMQEYVQGHPGIVRKMLRSLVTAEEFVKQHPEEAQQITAGQSRLDRDVVRELWAPETFIVTLDQSLLLALEDESRWAMKNGLVTGTTVPNYLNFIYFDGLEAVKPKAVRILR
jgi:sulfonate transport system substrate-binding protein